MVVSSTASENKSRKDCHSVRQITDLNYKITMLFKKKAQKS
jgi:hypothetical protein